MLPKKKRKYAAMEGHYGGGHKQRRESERAFYLGLDLQSPLAAFLLTTYLMGQLALPTVQCIARLAFDEPSKHPDLERLAGLGGYGANTSHMSRDLSRKLAPPPAFGSRIGEVFDAVEIQWRGGVVAAKPVVSTRSLRSDVPFVPGPVRQTNVRPCQGVDRWVLAFSNRSPDVREPSHA